MKKTLYLSLIVMMLAITDVQSSTEVDSGAGTETAASVGTELKSVNDCISALREACEKNLRAGLDEVRKIQDLYLDMYLRDIYVKLNYPVGDVLDLFKAQQNDNFVHLLEDAHGAQETGWNKFYNNIYGGIEQVYVGEKETKEDVALLSLLLFKEVGRPAAQWVFYNVKAEQMLNFAHALNFFSGDRLSRVSVSITFDHCAFSDNDMLTSFGTMLASNIVRELSVINCEIDKDNIALCLSGKVETLNLSGNGINDEDAKVIAEFIKNNPNLVKLDLSNNEIGDEGAKAIGNALKENYCLISIDLSNNKIGVEGTGAIGEAIKKNKGLIDLDLSGNERVDDTVMSKIFGSQQQWLHEKGRLSRSPSPSPASSPVPVAS